MGNVETTHVATTVTDPFAWILSSLWADDVDVEFVEGADGDRTFLTRPDNTAPELLVPASPPRATATIARRSHDARGVSARVRAAVVEAVSGLGVMPLLAPGRLVSLRLGSGTDDPQRSLPAWVARQLNESSIVFAVTIGGERYNRKPVLTVFSARGALLAFVKVGVDPLTDDYVTNEARWLATIAAARPSEFEAPPVIASSSWHGHPVLVTGPVFPPRLPARLRVDHPPAGLVAAVAALDDEGLVAVSANAVIAAAMDSPDPRLEQAAEQVLRRHGDIGVHTGAWHGDLSPWNLATRRQDPTLVWDWEAAESGRARGADLLHSLVMVPTHLRAVAPADAIAALRADELCDLQPDRASCAAALDLYLLDVARRDQEIIDGGVDQHLLPGIGRAALERLTGDD